MTAMLADQSAPRTAVPESCAARAARTARLHFADAQRPGRCFRCNEEYPAGVGCAAKRWAAGVLALEGIQT